MQVDVGKEIDPMKIAVKELAAGTDPWHIKCKEGVKRRSSSS